MRSASRKLTVVLAITVSLAACASDRERDEDTLIDTVLAPTTLSAVPGQDFVDALGRKWTCTGKVTPRRVDVAAMERTTPPITPQKAIAAMGVAELAEKLRPRRLVGQYEYRLAEPDYVLAQRIVDAVGAGKAPPITDEHAPVNPMVATATDVGLTPQWTIGPTDDRSQVAFPASPPFSSFAKVAPGCTATMIGRSTALSAAHCYYQNGWLLTEWVAFGANNPSGTLNTPFGQYLFDSVTIPGEWNIDELDWDFAVLEFSPTRYPGDVTGWRGTELSMSGTQRMAGYPQDKPFGSMWYKSGTYTVAVSARYEHNLDIMKGDSGACCYNTSSRCTGIQSSQFQTPQRTWNEVRRWDWTTHNFFDAYGNWP